ncbi:T9SS type A sorting domain-containing protein [Hymenobacter sp. BT664]|uniref:T9SS type A sorting domain-containing protein n=1 Tax=Hymenobacter montanus TaxID=2771359 RepID=A0A927B9D9_9BACT|nr:YCF48-related protein [Hymenobacter montanus]MBD2766550.1 T9SS type A sorting domain-containing protein [Hymenobacter montanus]
MLLAVYSRKSVYSIGRLVAGLLAALVSLPTLAQAPTYPVADLPYWEWQSPRPTGYPLQAVAALDDQTALVGGQRGTLFKTADQGQTWTPLSSGALYDIKALSFISPQVGWLANNTPNASFGNDLSGPGQVRKTIDGGRNWSPQAIGEADFVEMQDLRFFSATQGYVFYYYNAPGTGRPPRLRVTNNGGQTWNPVVIFAGTTALQFVTPQVGYFTANGGVTKTSNGGQNFELITPAPGISYNKVHFVDAQNGWVGSSTGGSSPNLFRTQNGGTTWTPVRLLGSASNSFPGVNKIAFADPLHGVINNYVTSDGGQTWTPGTGTLSTGPTQLRPSGVGFSVGTAGNIRTTTDFGLTGQARTTGAEAFFGTIHFPEPVHGWAMGKPSYNYNQVFVTHDRGTTWLGLDLTTRAAGVNWLDSRLTAGAFPDRDTAYVAGIDYTASPRAFILRTVDAGQTWNRQLLGPATALNDLKFRDGQNGIAVGNQGVIFYTRTGGNSWLSATSGTTTHLRKVCWAAPQVAYAMGDAGTLLTTQNGGQTWQTIVSSTFAAHLPEANWENLYFSSATTGFYGNASAIYRTTNGGSTWAATGQGTYTFGRPLVGAAFSSASNGWAFGMELFQTSNGGQSWTPRTLGLQATAGSFVDAYNGWVAGENNMIIHYSEKFIQTDAALTQRLSYCAGEMLDLAFTTEGSLSQLPTDYRVQLSNNMGRFRAGATLTLTPTAGSTARLLRVVLPTTLAAGTRYRVRVIAADSSVLGDDNKRDLLVTALTTATITPADPTLNLCQGSTATLTAPAGLTQYLWSTGATTRSITVSTAGTYTVRGALAAGCLGPASAPVTVALVPLPAQPVLQRLANGQLSVSAPVSGATYQWLLNGSPIPGATGATYPTTGAAPAGIYTVVSSVNGCASPASAPLAVVLAVRSAQAAGVAVYPNPAGDVLHVAFPAFNGWAHVALADLLGRTVRELVAPATGGTLDVRQLPEGLYTLRVELPSGEMLAQKVLVRH